MYWWNLLEQIRVSELLLMTLFESCISNTGKDLKRFLATTRNGLIERVNLRKFENQF